MFDPFIRPLKVVSGGEVHLNVQMGCTMDECNCNCNCNSTGGSSSSEHLSNP